MSVFPAQFFPRQNARSRPKPRMWTLLGMEQIAGPVRSLWRRLAVSRAQRGSAHRLQVVEKIHLGEKQFIALVELDGQSFLASGAPGAPLQIAPSPAILNRRPEPEPDTPTPGKPTQAEPKAAPEPVSEPQLPEQESFFPAIAAAPPELPLSKRRRGRPSRTLGRLAASKPVPDMPLLSETQSLAALRASSAPMPGAIFHPEVAPLLPGDLAAISTDVVEPVKRTDKEVEPTAQPTRPSLAQAVAQARADKPVRKPRRAAVPKQLQLAQVKASPAALDKAEAALTEGPADAPLTTFARSAAARAAATISKAEAPLSSETAEPEKTDQKLDPTFAALLHIRMLATEVFQEIDAKPVLPPPPPKPSSLPRRFSISACLLAALLIPQASAHAAVLAAAPPGGDIHITGLGGSSAPWSIVVVLTLLTLLPSLLFCITPFARLLIVFHFLRQALGLQTTPSNQTLIGLSLILTFFLMQPTGEVIYRDAILPVQAGKLTPLDGVARAGEPMRRFMAHYVREKDAQLFLEIAHEPRPRTVEDMSFRVLLPAYLLSELKAGFQIGTVLFLPFLIVDMVIASITTSVGMVQLPPVVISTPLKLLLFLMVDGWHLLIGSLMRSFN